MPIKVGDVNGDGEVNGADVVHLASFVAGIPGYELPDNNINDVKDSTSTFVNNNNSNTLANIKARGYLLVGVSTGKVGFAAPDDNGIWQGIEADFCRAIAVAIFNDPYAVKFTPLEPSANFNALAAGEVDVLFNSVVHTFSRDVDLKFNFTDTYFYDGQGFMVRYDLGIASALALDGSTISFISDSVTELNVADYFMMNQMSYEPLPASNLYDIYSNANSQAADVTSVNVSELISVRTQLAEPKEWLILPEVISKAPFAGVVRHGDDQWFNLVNWVLRVTIIAEELDINSSNVDDHYTNVKLEANPEIVRLLGYQSNFGESLGVDNNFVYNIIKKIGNYGEIFENNLGAKTEVKLDRGLNALWTNGGLLYGPPFR